LRAKQKKEASRNDFGIFEKPVSSIEQNGIVNETIHAREIAAEKAGVSETTCVKTIHFSIKIEH